MRVVNVGGSLTTALVLSAAAWGVRLLRANNILGPAERPSKPATRTSSKALYGRLSPVAFRLLLELEAVPFLLVDVRTPEEAQVRPLSVVVGQSFAARAKAVLLPGAHPLCARSPALQLTSPPCAQSRTWPHC